ncbi:hypothetical protein SETIT_6G171900v2 [Setaria italica]|uniref:Replication factor-A protein 1 N-terminal domain-containing protein n=1 Tax=Setaria italica TaxID=4555 RepID=A0A368RME7_SETIT|nr:hypothetical protein SETIT_6G171900v2 [Setaria italica]
MQVIRAMISEKGKLEEIHLVLSDGVHSQNATLASHLNHLVTNNHLRMGTVVRLLEFMCNTIQSTSVVRLEVLQTDYELIGSPKTSEQGSIGKPYGLQIKCGEPNRGSVPNYAQPDNASYSSGQGLKWLLTRGAVVVMLEGTMAMEQQPVMQVVDVSLVLEIECELIGSPRFHKLGLEHKELYVNRAANFPVLHEQSYVAALGPLEDAAKMEWSIASWGQIHA